MAVSSEGVVSAAIWPGQGMPIEERAKDIGRRFFGPSATTLVSPAADFFMAGGGAIALFIIFYFFIPSGTAIQGWALALWYVSFFVNYPHFMVSYQLLYGDARAGFFDFKNHRKFAVKLWWAGIIVPALLVTYFFFALLSGNLMQMGFLAQAMFFFVGWHYIKQIYGCVIVLSAAKKIFYSRLEQYSLLVPLYLLWGVSFINANLSAGPLFYQEVPYMLLSLPPKMLTYCWLACLVASAWLLAVFIRKYLRERVLPPWSALAAVAAIYVWFSPLTAHPLYFYIIPLLHSMQYLLFVTAYKRNAATAGLVQPSEREHTLSRLNLIGGALFIVLPAAFIALALWSPYARLPETIVGEWYRSLGQGSTEAWAIAFLSLAGISLIGVVLKKLPSPNAYVSFSKFFLLAFALGAVAFCLFPVFLDTIAKAGKLPGILSYPSLFGGALYVFFVSIFINIHHYFIDNVIWKRDNPYVREHLMLRPAPVADRPTDRLSAH